MKKWAFVAFTGVFTVCQITPAFAKSGNFAPIVETLDNNITATVYGFKKKKHYVAVEIGFTNPTGDYLSFTPTEIYLNDEGKYAKAPLPPGDVTDIVQRTPDAAIIPGALAVGLGLAAIGTGIAGEGKATKGLSIAALGAGGAYALTKSLENRAKTNKLITFENNSIDSIKRLPPGMTLGGYLYFPRAKHPTSVTLIVKGKDGKYENKTFFLAKN